MACDTIKMEISANPEYVGIIRLTTSGIANKIGFTIDEIEDIKVAISEACTNAIKHSDEDKFNIVFNIMDNGIEIEVHDKGKGCDVSAIKIPDLENPKESGLGIFIMKTLMDDVCIESTENKGTVIKMTKYLGADY
ncbi:histidine kinase [Peptacetobacter hominis]|uniref:Histidine kinase n=1 Tax=Peptacetobacter hominis TaxID=2743610 RepID=A0A544QV98_9FIRM|nr:ATP-binding protein [Peptacetobacter hominis]TQQ84596.1 histidine kinase [Peptacetobacter hominis]